MALRVIPALTVAVEGGVTGYIGTYGRVEAGITGYIGTHRRRSELRYGFFMALTVAVEGDGLYRHLPSPLRVALRVSSTLTVAVEGGVTCFIDTHRRRWGWFYVLYRHLTSPIIVTGFIGTYCRRWGWRIISALTVAVEGGVTGFNDTHRRRWGWRYGFYRHSPSPLRVVLRIISALNVANNSYGFYRHLLSPLRVALREFKNLVKHIIIIAPLKKNENLRFLNFVKSHKIRN